MTGDLRVGDTERDRAAALLGEHYSAGRLTHAEYAERLDAIWTARTRRDLDDVFHDLPQVALGAGAVAARPARTRWLGWPYNALLLLIIGGLLITHPLMLILFALALILFRVGRRRHHHRGLIRHW